MIPSKEAKIKTIEEDAVAVTVECPYCEDTIFTEAMVYKGKGDKDKLYHQLNCDECESFFDVPPVTINKP